MIWVALAATATALTFAALALRASGKVTDAVRAAAAENVLRLAAESTRDDAVAGEMAAVLQRDAAEVAAGAALRNLTAERLKALELYADLARAGAPGAGPRVDDALAELYAHAHGDVADPVRGADDAVSDPAAAVAAARRADTVP